MSDLTITANGEDRSIPPGTTVSEFIKMANLPPERVAVEHNGRILPRDRFAAVKLEEGDRLEVVTLVGGG